MFYNFKHWQKITLAGGIFIGFIILYISVFFFDILMIWTDVLCWAQMDSGICSQIDSDEASAWTWRVRAALKWHSRAADSR